MRKALKVEQSCRLLYKFLYVHCNRKLKLSFAVLLSLILSCLAIMLGEDYSTFSLIFSFRLNFRLKSLKTLLNFKTFIKALSLKKVY